jgi:hypothetical protein
MCWLECLATEAAPPPRPCPAKATQTAGRDPATCGAARRAHEAPPAWAGSAQRAAAVLVCSASALGAACLVLVLVRNAKSATGADRPPLHLRRPAARSPIVAQSAGQRSSAPRARAHQEDESPVDAPPCRSGRDPRRPHSYLRPFARRPCRPCPGSGLPRPPSALNQSSRCVGQTACARLPESPTQHPTQHEA